MKSAGIPTYLRLVVTVVILTAGVVPAVARTHISVDDTRQALLQLDRALRQRNEYIAIRQAGIDSLRERLHGEPASLPLILDIADRYTSFNTDSALHYLAMGKNMASDSLSAPFAWRRATLLPLVGLFEQARDEFYSIDPAKIADTDKEQYLMAGRQMNSYMAAYYSSFDTIHARYTDSALVYQQRLISVLPPQSRQSRYNQAEYFFMTGHHSRAELLLEEIVASEPSHSNVRARAAHHLSSIARGHADSLATTYYLALSALADVQGATREMVSLQELGTVLSDAGDVERAYRYLSTALEVAVECGASLRTLDTSQTLPVIEKAYNQRIESWRTGIYLIIAALSVLLLILLGLLIFLRHEMNKMARLQRSLSDANRTKEVYISQFLELCSIYMDKLNQFSKIVTRKLAAGQADELYRMTKSGKFVDEQSREFYEVFDAAFLHIYPDFVADVNRLLRPDARIELHDGELLNTDLRILAFMRLGIDDSARIAQVLNYSLNTIYSYRNRIKGRAINRDTFENDVANISNISAANP